MSRVETQGVGRSHVKEMALIFRLGNSVRNIVEREFLVLLNRRPRWPLIATGSAGMPVCTPIKSKRILYEPTVPAISAPLAAFM